MHVLCLEKVEEKKCHVSAVSHWSAARNGSESESDSDGSEIPIPELSEIRCFIYF